MPGLNITLDADTVTRELGDAPLEDALQGVMLLRDAMSNGRPAAVFVAVDSQGKKHYLVTSLRLLRMATQALCTKAEMELGKRWYWEASEVAAYEAGLKSRS